MPTQTGTLEALAREVALALRPLEARLGDAEEVYALLERMGLYLPSGIMDPAAVAQAVGGAVAAVRDLGPLLSALAEAVAAGDPAEIVRAGASLAGAVKAVVAALGPTVAQVRAVVEAAGDLDADDRARLAAFAAAFPGRLVEMLVLEYLDAKGAAIVPAMEVAGVVERVDEPGVPGRRLFPPYTRRALRLDRLGRLLSDPEGHFADAFRWGEADFDGVRLFGALGRLVEATGGEAVLVAGDGLPTLLDLFALRLEVDRDGPLPGIEGSLRLPLSAAQTLPFPIGGGWDGWFSGAGTLDASTGVRVDPPLRVSLTPPELAASFTSEAGVRGTGPDGGPLLLLGSPGGPRIEADEVTAALELSATAKGTALEAEPGVRAAVRGGRVVIEGGQGDGFVASLLKDVRVEAPFDVAARWTPSGGLRFDGQAGARFTVETAIELGPVRVDGVTVGLTARPDGLRVEAGAAVAAALGPLRLAVDQVGVSADVDFPAGGTDGGPARVEIQFLSPTGVGVTVDAAAVSGGGFLKWDGERGQYAGAMELTFQALSLKAVGLLSTKQPDGSPIPGGYSLLLMISGEFTPVQLGYGFTLNAVGGLVGVHRTMAVEVLRAGLRDRSLDAVMFPRDPVGEAPRILATLARAFPAARNRFVLGPMARLGWGTPTLLTLDLGLVMELPSPLRLAALGRLRMVLPDERAAVVRINMDVLGVVDFGRQEAAIDATLYDSSIAGFPVSGDMAMRARWGRNPTFALSAGGFNPRYQPPPGFPRLRRMAIALANGDNPRIRLEAYLALTSNTVQFGARLEVRAEAAGFTVEGMLAFDALLLLDPFRFVVDLVAQAALRRGRSTLMSIGLTVTLSGPRPWHARGKATFELWFVKATVRFDVRAGRSERLPAPDPVDVAGRVADALKDPRSWTAQLPRPGETGVAFRAIRPGPNELVAHPLGEVGFTQRVAPLGVVMERYGAAPIKSGTPNRLDVASVKYGSDTLTRGDDAREAFAPGQFFDLSDDEKLSLPSFQEMVAGQRLKTTGARTKVPTLEVAPMDYETILIDGPPQPPEPVANAALLRAAKGGAAGMAATRTAGALRYEGASIPLSVGDTRYTVAAAASSSSASTTTTLRTASVLDDDAPLSWMEARQRLAEIRAADPDGTRTLRVVPATGGAR